MEYNNKIPTGRALARTAGQRRRRRRRSRARAPTDPRPAMRAALTAAATEVRRITGRGPGVVAVYMPRARLPDGQGAPGVGKRAERLVASVVSTLFDTGLFVLPPERDDYPLRGRYYGLYACAEDCAASRRPIAVANPSPKVLRGLRRITEGGAVIGVQVNGAALPLGRRRRRIDTWVRLSV